MGTGLSQNNLKTGQKDFFLKDDGCSMILTVNKRNPIQKRSDKDGKTNKVL